MKFAEASLLISQYLFDTQRLYNPDFRESDLTWLGGGTFEEARIAKEVEVELPTEFRIYLDKYAPHKDLYVGSFYQSFELYGFTKLSIDNGEMWGNFSECEDVVSIPFVIGQDTAIAFITDLSQENCPVYYVDEVYDWQPKLMAHTLADFLTILFHRNYAIKKFVKDFNLHGNLEANKLNEQLDNEVNQRILNLCPSSVKLWT
jgi:hypothetical protein